MQHAHSKPEEACAIYVRRSSAGGNGANKSLAEQEVEVRALAAAKGLPVVHVYAEKEGTGASRFSRKSRPEWASALAELEAGDRFRTLVVFALDRADRKGADDMARIIRRHAETGRRILGVDGTDTGDPHRRMETIIRLEVAAEEVERLSSRVTRTKRHRRAEGRWLGGLPPYGLQVDSSGHLEPHPDTHPIARRIAESLLSGATLWSVVRDLNAEGVPGPDSVRLLRAAERTKDADEATRLRMKAESVAWRVPTLAAMVKSPAWAGLQSIRRRTPSGGWEQVAEVFRDETGEPVSVGQGVVSREERALILAALASRTVERLEEGRIRRSGRPTAGAGLLLADVLRCETCGLRAGVSGSPAHRSYRCARSAQGGATCKGFTAPLDALDEHIAVRVRARLRVLEPDAERDESWHPSLVAAAKVWAGDASPEVRQERARLTGALAEAREDDARVKALALAGALLPEEAAEERRKTGERIRRAEEALTTVGSGEPDPAALLDAATTAEAWACLDAPTRRRVIAAVVLRVTVTKASARGVRFKPEERVQIEWR